MIVDTALSTPPLTASSTLWKLDTATLTDKGKQPQYAYDQASSDGRSTGVESRICEEDWEVKFKEADALNPYNWPVWKKWTVTLFSAALVLNSTMASSLPAGNLPDMVATLHFSQEVGTLTLSLFVLGFAFGPILWGPLSEQYGRRIVYLIAFTLYLGSQVGCALAPNTAAILAFRLLGGVFAAAPFTNSGGMISDMFDAVGRTVPVAVFTITPFAGPALAPMISGYMADASITWRWVYWMEAMLSFLFLLAVVFLLPESFKPVLLAKRAERLRKDTGDSRWWAPHERNSVSFFTRMRTILTKPFKLLITEPMLMAMTLYMSFIYGVLYLFFNAYPIVFGQGHHMAAGTVGLMFLPICVGGIIGGVAYIFIFGSAYAREVAKCAPNPVPPEFRLKQCIYAAPLYPLAIFWFGWTTFPHITFWAPMSAGLVIGFSIVWLFLGMFAYIIDTYLATAASGIAVAIIVRSFFGAAFPLFASQMYHGLGAQWATTILGCIALLLTPIPFVLIKFGPRLRQMSKASQSHAVAATAQPSEKPSLSLKV